MLRKIVALALFLLLVGCGESLSPQQQATWMDWGPYPDGQLSFRHVFRENPRVAEIATALVGGTVSAGALPYVPIAKPCTREVFERGGWPACLVE